VTEVAVAIIRPASSPDAANLARMHVESWRETYPGLVPQAMLSSLSVDARTAAWSRILAEPSQATAVFVTELGGRIVGFGSCGKQRAEALRLQGYDGEIHALYVLKGFQRRALGTGLLSAMAAHMQGRGMRAASLWVLRNNAPARCFYEHRGAQLLAEREDVRPEGVLFEVAYGWPDLTAILPVTGGASGPPRPSVKIAGAGDQLAQ
jgi:ribosomal protein S18 acetylase RimI-like enzyme